MSQPLPERRPEVIVGDEAALADALCSRVQSLVEVRRAVTWSLAVPGGSVAERILPRLARADLPWTHAHVFFVDERAVEADDPSLNWNICREHTRGTTMELARWHQMPVTPHGLRRAARKYADLVESILGTPCELDVVLLGVGEDGHVASLFPGHAVLESEAAIDAELHSPKPPRRRMTMTLPLLARARLTCLVGLGASKRDAMRQALDPRGTSPAARLLASARAPVVLMDQEADA